MQASSTRALTYARSAAFARGAAFALTALLASSPSFADDSDLFTTSAAPNVMVLFDNSGSMSNVVWHPAYHPDAYYSATGCVAEGDVGYDPACMTEPLCTEIVFGDTGDTLVSSGAAWNNSSDTALRLRSDIGDKIHCGNTRYVFAVPSNEAASYDTRWSLQYLQWYFSDNTNLDHDGDGRTIYEEILDTDDGVLSPCVEAQNPTWDVNYPKYQRSRMDVGKEVLYALMCEANESTSIRFGLAIFDEPGGEVLVGAADYTDNRSDLETALSGLNPGGWTPLAGSLYDVYRYYQSRSNRVTYNSNTFSAYTITDINGSVPPTPITADCQKSFVILITDGEPAHDDFNGKTNIIGDYNAAGDEDETPPNNFFSPAMTNATCGGDAADDTEDSCRLGVYLDDVAKFMHDNDFQLDTAYPSDQTIDTYTIGFSTTSAANTFLDRAAAAGGGEFFSSKSADDLLPALKEVMFDISTKAKSFTAASVPASRSTDGSSFIVSYFRPEIEPPYWEGHLKMYEFTANGEIRDAPASGAPVGTHGPCALVDPLAPTRCKKGPLNLSLNGFWDAANAIPAPASRNLKMSLGGSMVDLGFDSAGIGAAAAADVFPTGTTTAVIADYTSLFGATATSGISDLDDLGDALIGYIRGCEFGTGSCIDRGNGRKLWDIFHSNPVVVGPPNAPLGTPSYEAFASKYKHRTRIVYAGSNGGFLHGFNAGTWQTSPAPAHYDFGDGTELMGFMPYPVREKMWDLARGEHPYLVDGSPQTADVWFNPTAQIYPDGTTSADEWHTVVVGGLREGGEALYALDITNPDGVSGGPNYPAYLWEFPVEGDTATSCGGIAPLPCADYMGQTWSEPIITKVKLENSCTDPCVHSKEKWVAIFGAGYHPEGDPNEVSQDHSYDASVDASTSRKGRALFMVDIVTGSVIAMKHFDDSSVDGEPEMKYALASTPAVFDLDFDGFADVVYIGDLGGNLWKWAIHEPVAAPSTNWPFLRVFEAVESSGGRRKSIFFPPAGTLLHGRLYLAFGTGERNDLQYIGADTSEKNRFYVLRDVDPTERYLTAPTGARYNDDGMSGHMLDATSVSPDCTGPAGDLRCHYPRVPISYAGFFLERFQGEKFITDTVIFRGEVLTGSYVPDPAAGACDPQGSGALWRFDLIGGYPRWPDPDDPSEENNTYTLEVGDGLPTRPKVSMGDPDGGGGPGNCDNMIVVITSEGEAFTDCPGAMPTSGVHMKSWRDF